MRRITILMALAAASSWAGALTLEVSKPDTVAQAASMHALMVARVTACTEPAKSVVTASWVRYEGGQLRRTALKVAVLNPPGAFAIVGDVPAGSMIDLTVTNPDYKNYSPQVLLRTDAQGVQWEGARRFYNTPPTDSDMKQMVR